LPWHERDLVAELAVARVEQGIGGDTGSRVVHARHHHRGGIAGRVRWVDIPGGVIQAVVGSPLVGIHAGDFVAVKILDSYRQVGRRELLAELRRKRVEFRCEVVGDHAREVGGGVRRGKEPELR